MKNTEHPRISKVTRRLAASSAVLMVAIITLSAGIAVSARPMVEISLLALMILSVAAYCLWSIALSSGTAKSEPGETGRDFNFLKIVADNIQAPLLSMMNDLRKLMQRTNNDDHYNELHSLYAQGFQLQGNINDALELSRPEEPEEGEARVVNLQMLASDIGENYAQILSDKPDVSLSILVDHTLPQTVTADPRRIMHLIGNLLENAIRFSLEGQIVLKIAAVNSGKVEPGHMMIQITCADSGYGIERVLLDKMNSELQGNFDPSGIAQIGLGLRAAHNIVTYYRGSIKLSSDQGKGTTATAMLLLPVSSSARSWNDLPHSFRFFSSSNDLHIMLGNAALFHGIRAISVREPKPQSETDMIFIDARDIYSGSLGPSERFEPRHQYVVMLDQNQPRVRSALLNAGFTRFLMIPFASTTLLQYLSQEDAPVAPQKRMSSVVKTTGRHVLVVDDTETSRLCVCDHLRNAGYAVTEASDGLEMVSLIRSGNTFDLILSDLTMTYLDGEQAMKQVHEFEALSGRRTPIVAMTAYGAVDTADALKRAGFSAVLQKPVFLDELDYLIANICDSTPAPKEQTQFINIDDLKERTAGKAKLMAILLDSFINSSQTHLQDLLRTEPVPNKVLQVKALHTIKGLLLEAGASECARQINIIEKRISFSPEIPEKDLRMVKEIVEKVGAEAARIQKDLRS